MKQKSRMCILIGGMPASGKSTFAEWLGKELEIPVYSKDSIKEKMFDTVGFGSREEKVRLGLAAMDLLYYIAEQEMKSQRSFILENNFEDVSGPGLTSLLEKYHYEPIIVIFDGDINVIYDRFIQRDMAPERHRGHVVNTEYPEKAGSKAEYVPMGFANFEKRIQERGWRRFRPGNKIIDVDCTDFAKVNYERIAEQIRAYMD